jgi:hypothetical protein
MSRTDNGRMAALVAFQLLALDAAIEVREVGDREVKVCLGDPGVLTGTPLDWTNSSTFVLKIFQTS